MNECGACHEDFGSLSAFDRHQRLVGMVLTCLDPAEIGMHRDQNGRWRMKPRDESAMITRRPWPDHVF